MGILLNQLCISKASHEIDCQRTKLRALVFTVILIGSSIPTYHCCRHLQRHKATFYRRLLSAPVDLADFFRRKVLHRRLTFRGTLYWQISIIFTASTFPCYTAARHVHRIHPISTADSQTNLSIGRQTVAVRRRMIALTTHIV